MLWRHKNSTRWGSGSSRMFQWTHLSSPLLSTVATDSGNSKQQDFSFASHCASFPIMYAERGANNINDPYSLQLATVLLRNVATRTGGRCCRASSGRETLWDDQPVKIFIWSPKFNFRVHKSPSLVSIVSQMNSLHTLTPYFKIHFNIILISVDTYVSQVATFLPFTLYFACVTLRQHILGAV
jgi:hypothetical protein